MYIYTEKNMYVHISLQRKDIDVNRYISFCNIYTILYLLYQYVIFIYSFISISFYVYIYVIYVSI